MEIIISGAGKPLKQVEELARRLGLKIRAQNTEVHSHKTERVKALEALKTLRKTNAFTEIDDLQAWQKAVRKDRNIGRND